MFAGAFSRSTGYARSPTLLFNHVLAAEPAAVQRLAPHAGRTIEGRVNRPLPWPMLGTLRVAITRAGLLELADEVSSGHGVRARVRLRDPREWLIALPAGMRAPIEVEGDAQLAADLGWVFTHVRFDIADDLASLIGDAPAHQLARFAGAGVQVLRRLIEPRPR